VAHAHNGTYNNAPTLAQPSLLPTGEGACVKFNGTTHSVSIADHVELRVGDVFALMSVVYLEQLGVTQTLVSAKSGHADFRVGSTNKIELLKNNVANVVASTVALEEKKPYLCFVTKNGATVKLYLGDFTARTFTDVTGAVTNATMEATESTWQLAMRSGAGDDILKGKQQYAGIGATALSQATLEGLFTAGSTTPSTAQFPLSHRDRIYVP
jgi:hypothetical protein